MSTPEELASAKERGWRELADIDAALDGGEIDEAGWHARTTSLTESEYLAGNDPRAQSGHSGDARRWERARRLLVDALVPGTVLDVGCANGLLMSSLQAWAAEDGVRIEPYGVEISPALAELGRVSKGSDGGSRRLEW